MSSTPEFLPFPEEHSMIDGNKLMDEALETLLNSCGVPVELYKDSLDLQPAPRALAMFDIPNTRKLATTLSPKPDAK